MNDTNKTAFVFPGQGSQFVGMGKDIYDASPAANRVFRDAEEVLGFSLRNLCFEGPEDELTDTINAQPAILTASIACLQALREKCDEQGISLHPDFVAGHSLGEYSALVAAGALEFRDAVALVRERGRLMKESGETNPGGMAAVMGLDNDALQRVCDQAAEAGTVIIANYNCPGQTVISGDNIALHRAIELATEAGARRALRLAVSIASHSPLMRGATLQFESTIRSTKFNPATIPVVCNLTATPISTVEDIQQELIEQLCNSVRWEQSINCMVEAGTSTFIEIGPGQVLAGLIKRISKQPTLLNVGDAKSLGATIAAVPKETR